ncbi:MAG: imidazole glycerol phosphate synthase subunit HisH [Oscillospiraceae bacterium]|jgi:glutamine amidotransferase|nr:imidazole glycerol phosphate synthase subunit HisH [Oscillospiraceae bacterium]
MIGIIDYGAGNLHSVANAFRKLGVETFVSGDTAELAAADKLILPGVGAFPMAMARLSHLGLVPFIRAWDKPLLGICLGMQLLFEIGNEIERGAGLSLIPGEVRRIEPGDPKLRLPHIGWNSLDIARPSRLLEGIEPGSYMYFVHSFCAEPSEPETLIASCGYGEQVAAVVQLGNYCGCQFHPEKSGDVGLRIYANFAKL